MSNNEPICVGKIYFLIKNLFKPSINKLIDHGNIKELVRIAIMPPNIKEYNKIINSLVKIDITKSIEYLLIVYRDLEKQYPTSEEYSSNNYMQKTRAYCICVHNIGVIIKSFGGLAIGELIKYIDDKNSRIRRFVIDELITIGTENIEVINQISNLIANEPDINSKNIIKILKKINKKAKDIKIKDKINILLADKLCQ